MGGAQVRNGTAFARRFGHKNYFRFWRRGRRRGFLVIHCFHPFLCGSNQRGGNLGITRLPCFYFHSEVFASHPVIPKGEISRKIRRTFFCEFDEHGDFAFRFGREIECDGTPASSGDIAFDRDTFGRATKHLKTLEFEI